MAALKSNEVMRTGLFPQGNLMRGGGEKENAEAGG